MKRQSGVLLPVFSLPGKYGCGVFGEAALHWIDFLSESGFSCWQVLPFGVADGYGSPYASLSSFGGNPFFIDPDELLRRGLVTAEECREQEEENRYICQYESLGKKRLPFLKKAALRVKDRGAVEAFLEKNLPVAETCRFLASMEANGYKRRQDWTAEPGEDDVFSWQFIQYEFHRQWEKIHAYAGEKGISVIGDMPFYVSDNSYDVWASPEQFLLDKDGNPTQVAGVPPDYFSAEGQKWGNPLYNWEEMEKDGFSWWKRRLSYMLSLFDGLRIDHFRAISSYWSVPRDAETAKSGQWQPGPGEKLIDAFKSAARGKMLLAEDLGIIDGETRALLEYSGFPGMAVFQFGFDGNPLSPHLPHNYRENLVAYTGTHDNNTLLGFLWELDESARAAVMDYLGDPPDGCAAAMRALMMSRAGTVIFPVQDLLGFGADTRINVPGTAEGNWRYRVTGEQLDSLDRKKLAHLNRIYAR